jgi:hypothetical protein
MLLQDKIAQNAMTIIVMTDGFIFLVFYLQYKINIKYLNNNDSNHLLRRFFYQNSDA